jgi:hypothetical protein
MPLGHDPPRLNNGPPDCGARGTGAFEAGTPLSETSACLSQRAPSLSVHGAQCGSMRFWFPAVAAVLGALAAGEASAAPPLGVVRVSRTQDTFYNDAIQEPL